MSNHNLKMTFRPVPVAGAPDFNGTAVPKSIDDLGEALKSKVGSTVVKSIEKAHAGDPFLLVDPTKILDVLSFLRDDQKFLCTLLQVIAATDYLPIKAAPAVKDESGQEASPAVKAREGFIEVAYFLWSFQHRHQFTVKVQLERGSPKVQSACDLFRAANWYERECYDLLGVVFEGHPNLERILLSPDWVGHPLRRDYVFPEEYNGMKVPL